MPKCTIDGIDVEFQTGENLVEIAKKAGVNIPVFCYHSGLSVVAQCRMCAVEIENMPKLQTACSMVATDGMVVHTKSERAEKNRESVMEFLLINHPLDCPICDKAGECDLQDFSFDHGSPHTRYTEEKRTYLDLDMGPVIEKNMNRCIHCTRCIRFGDEIAKQREMVALQRGNNVEITTLDGRSLETDYAGNYADVCPTGSLTLKDFRFNKRVWMLKKTPTVCEGCSRGCNMEIHHEANQMYRCLPRENLEINNHWLCDEGRFHFNDVQKRDRVVFPKIKESDKVMNSTWDDAVLLSRELVANKKGAVLIGSDLTQEEIQTVLDFSKSELSGFEVSHFGTPSVANSEQDGDEDQILKRLSKTSNLNGIEELGVKSFTKLSDQTEVVFVVSGGRAQLPELSNVRVIGLGVFFNKQAEKMDVVFPGPSFAEKSGTVVNFQGKKQKINRAILPPEEAKELSEVLMLWMNANKQKGAQ